MSFIQGSFEFTLCLKNCLKLWMMQFVIDVKKSLSNFQPLLTTQLTHLLKCSELRLNPIQFSSADAEISKGMNCISQNLTYHKPSWRMPSLIWTFLQCAKKMVIQIILHSSHIVHSYYYGQLLSRNEWLTWPILQPSYYIQYILFAINLHSYISSKWAALNGTGNGSQAQEALELRADQVPPCLYLSSLTS